MTSPAIQRIFAIPHFHFDLEWWKTEQGYARDVAEILDAALAMLEQNPEFTFVLDQATAVKPYWDAHPEKQPLIRDMLAQGRIECVGGTWAAPDENIPTGESLIRNFLLGMRFFERDMGARVTCAWEIDEFGHPEQMPQIFAGCGLSRFVFARGVPMAVHQTHPTEFYWKAPDGATVLTHWLSVHYTGLVPLFGPFLNRKMFAWELRSRMAQQAPQVQSSNMFLPLGTDFQIPTRDWLAFLSEWNGKETGKIELSLPGRFFDALVREAGDSLPRVAGEFNPLLTGCYETREKIKRGCRLSQHTAMEAEKLAAVCHAFGWMPWPKNKFRMIWENILKNDFHDTICGTGTDAVYRESLGRYVTALEIAGDIREKAVHVIARHADTTGPGRAVAVVNSLNHARREPVSVPLEDSEINAYETGKRAHFTVLDPAGRAVPCQVSGQDILFPAEIPSMGYGIYRIKAVKNKAGGAKAAKESNPFKTRNNVFENGLVRLEIDQRTGGLVSLYDIRAGREALDMADERASNGLIVEEDAGNLWTVQKTGRVWCDADFPRPDIRVLETGPVRLVVEISGAHKGMMARRQIILHAHSARVDFRTFVDFTGRDLRIKAHFGAAGTCQAVFETPFCATERADGHHCAQNWVDMFDGAAGLALFNSGNPGHDVRGSSLDLVLMRSLSVLPIRKIARFIARNLPGLRTGLKRALEHTVKGLGVSLGEWDLYEYHGLVLREWSSAGPPADSTGRMNLMDHIRPMLTPDQPADCWEHGHHRFHYAALPHAGDFRAAALPLQALAFNTPLLAVPVKKSKGSLPKRHSFLSTGADPAVLLTALKKSEKGGGLTARVYDAHGQGAAFAFKTSLPVDTVRPVTLIERDTGRPAIKISSRQTLEPWRIETCALRGR